MKGWIGPTMLSVALLTAPAIEASDASKANCPKGSAATAAALGVPCCRPAAAATSDRPPCCDRSAFAQLQRMASSTEGYSVDRAERLQKLVFRLWEKEAYRHRVAATINLHSGYLDAMLNKIYVDEWHRTGNHTPNFHEVDSRLCRGGQPSAEGFRRLKEKGVAVVVNLRAEDGSEKAIVEGLGLRYIHLPIPDTDTPSYGQVNEFLGLLHDKSTGKVFVHCAAGANRTGTMVALWRVESGMPHEKALKEAREHGFQEKILAADREGALVRSFVRRRAPY